MLPTGNIRRGVISFCKPDDIRDCAMSTLLAMRGIAFNTSLSILLRFFFWQPCPRIDWLDKLNAQISFFACRKIYPFGKKLAQTAGGPIFREFSEATVCLDIAVMWWHTGISERVRCDSPDFKDGKSVTLLLNRACWDSEGWEGMRGKKSNCSNASEPETPLSRPTAV